MSEDEITLELNTKQVGALSLAIGLVIGGLAGFIAGGTTMASPTGSPSEDAGGSAETADMTPEESFRQISNDLDLDTDKVMQCYQDSDNEEAMEDRNNAVQSVGNFGTPTFFIGNRENGFVEITGAQPLSRFEQAFETVRSDDPGNLTSLEGIELEGEPSKGQEDATIKVVEYNEFGCPFCAEWQGIDASSRTPIDTMNIAQSLENQYVETGEVELISKDYPVPQLHPNGPLAHKAANCVYEHEQDSYWEFHDKLFENRDHWMQG
jgi:protein-disulfide isomerase